MVTNFDMSVMETLGEGESPLLKGGHAVPYKSAVGKATYHARTYMKTMFVFRFLDGSGYTFDFKRSRGQEMKTLDDEPVAQVSASGQVHELGDKR
jgi:hypothetical protein